MLGAEAFAALPWYVRDGDADDLAADLLAAMATPVAVADVWLRAGADNADAWLVTFERLPWLAGMFGVDLSGVPEGQRRAFTADPLTRNRGNRAAIRKRVGLTLTGSKTVQVTCPYGGDDFAALVVTYAAETPDEAATEAAVRAEMPAWLAVTYEARAGMSYADLGSTYATYDALEATGKSYDELSQETV